MIDNETMTNDTQDYTPDPEPAPSPEREPPPEPSHTSESSSEPEKPAAPVEVIPVDDLIDRLLGVNQGETEEPPQTEEEAPMEDEEPPVNDAVFNNGEPIEVVGMDKVLKHLETIQGTVDHPALTTPFEDYTVTEALLLLLFLAAFIAACVKMLKGGFAWLR